MARRSFRVTGTNNSAKQVSVDWTNDLAGVLERGVAVTPQDYGAVADGVTDDSAAFVAAIAYLNGIASNDDGTNKGSPRLFVPAGHYYMGTTTLDLTHTLIIEGEGSGQVGGVATQLRWADGVVGIRLQYYITSGNRQIVAAHSMAAGTQLRGLFLKSAGVTTATAHAIDAMVRFSTVDVSIYNWGGNGFNIVATAGGGAGLEGNANSFVVDRCYAYGCQHGLYASGADANAGTIIASDFSQNRGWGVFDECFLGNTYIACHTAGNTSGPYKTTNANATNLFLNCYSEGDQTASSLVPQTMVLGGQHAAGVSGGAARLYAGGNFEVVCDSSGGFVVKPTTGVADLTLNSANNHSRLRLYRADTYKGSVAYVQGTGVSYDAPTGEKHQFYFNSFATTGPAITATGVEIGGTKVVGAQGAALPADATDLASVITLANAIKARMKATGGHGLVAD